MGKLVLTVYLTCAGSVWARVHAPRVVSPHNADAYSMKTFAQFDRWRDLEGDALAWEVYKYLVDKRTGIFHMNEVLEGQDVLSEYRTVRDPVKIINVYGYAYCAIFGPVMAGVCEGIGLGKARTLVLPDWRHVATEVYYGGKWHYLDVDVRAVFRRPDGTLASMADARSDASLWTRRGPLFFPNDPLDRTRGIYQRTEVHHYHNFHTSGHTMDYVLRQGETFTRWWTPQGGRWHHAEVYHRRDWLKKLIESEPRGPKPNHRHFTVHNHGNGKFVYEPNLSEKSSDFADGVYSAQNVRPSDRGLTLARSGKGYAIFEVRSPYVIVPLVAGLETTQDDRDASVVEIDAAGASLSLSLDNGLRWRALQVASWPAKLDLTPHISGVYGYLLRIGLEGRPAEAVVRKLRVTTWVQVAPASLPSLRKGKNVMEYRIGDHYGLQSRVVAIQSNGSNKEDFLKYVVEPPEDYDPTRTTQRVRGPFVAKIDAAPGTRIVWFTAGANFRTHLHGAARKTRNAIAYAQDKLEEFRDVFRAEVPTDTEHWHSNADREVKLERPARTVYVRYHGEPALNNFRLYAHCVDDVPRTGSPVTITHVWKERGERRARTVEMKRPGSYEIVAESDPVDESIEMSVPSDVR